MMGCYDTACVYQLHITDVITLKEERVTTIGSYDIGKSTPLESNKSLAPSTHFIFISPQEDHKRTIRIRTQETERFERFREVVFRAERRVCFSFLNQQSR